jgi:hypothetical protein
VSIVRRAAEDGSLLAEATGAAAAVLVVTLLATVAYLWTRKQPE